MSIHFIMNESVLFICTGNWFRSKFAETYLRSKGYTNVISRGLKVNNSKHKKIREKRKISKRVKHKLKSLNILNNYNYVNPTQLTQDDLDRYDTIIAMNKEEHYNFIKKHYPNYINKIIFWDINDTTEGNSHEEDVILTKVMIKIDMEITHTSSQST